MSNAPVIIPTLCRHEHLKRCVESLECCTGACCTDVYIALDYPASSSHTDGWKVTDSWLSQKEKHHHFKSLTVIRRTSNMGLGIHGNIWGSVEEILRSHDRFILSEDDNVFSPAFLEYVNKGLDKFESDKSVLAINGYRHFYDIKFDGNNFYRQSVDFSAWGFGMWKDRFETSRAALERSYWIKKSLSPFNWFNTFRNGLNRLSGFIGKIAGDTSMDDNGLSVYMAVNGMDVVMPEESMVRNTGWDGSGQNCNINNLISAKHLSQPIYNSKTFDFKGIGNEFYVVNRRIYRQESYGRITWTDFFKHYYSKVLSIR